MHHSLFVLTVKIKKKIIAWSKIILFIKYVIGTPICPVCNSTESMCVMLNNILIGTFYVYYLFTIIK